MRERVSRLRHAPLTMGISACLLLGLTGSASAATTIGQNGAGGGGTCGAGNTFIQTGTAAGVPSYAVPAGGGIITSWSFLAGSTSGEQDRLKVVRGTATANQFFVVGEGALETMTPSALNTFLVRIPVQAGDRLGLFTADGNDCVVSTHTPGNTDAYVGAADPAPGTTITGISESSSGEAYNISAKVEPDTDHDGLGDETQDKCPGASGSLQGCPKADLSITDVASTTTVLRGRTVAYTLTAKNTGPDAAPNVVVTDGLPSGAHVVSASASSGSCVTGAAESCDLGTLGSGATGSVRLVVRMTSIGSTAETATVGSATLATAAHNAGGAGDTNPGNNSASTSTVVAGIANATQSHKTWREPSHPKLATLSKKRPPIESTFAFKLGAPARVRFAFTQRVRGRKVHGRCVTPTKANRHKPSCTRTVSRGSFSFAAHAGRNALVFQGRISASRKLKPGTYTVTITAITPGVGSTSARLTFTIVK